MRFQFAHKLVTYLLVLATLSALAATGALAAVSAALFVVAAALSFAVDPGGRAAAALDRAALAVRIGAVAVFALLLLRIGRGLPDPDYGPGFDLGLALLAYKLFHRRSHRDYVQILAFSFVLVLVSATLAASFLFVVAFAIYVGLAIWTLILFHLRREMEENYLVKHSAQAPSQKVGVQRILGSRRVVGPSFFAATGLVAAAVLAGGVAVFVVVPRFGAGFVLSGAPLPMGALASGEDMVIGRYGTAPAARHQVVLRATVPAIDALAGEDARRSAADGLYFRGAVYDLYEHGRWSRSRVPELGTLLVEDLAAGSRRFSVREPSDGAHDERTLEGAARQDLEGAVRQEIETVGMPVSVLFAIDRAVAFELPAAHLGAAGALRIVPRWSGETALRVGGSPTGASPILADAHYVAYSLPRPAGGGSGERPGADRDDGHDGGDGDRGHDGDRDDGDRGPALAPPAQSALVAVPGELGVGLGALVQGFSRLPDGGRRIAALVEWLRAHHRYSPAPPTTPAGADAVATFVQGQASGHCELFASAAVLLLRAAGIPARYVTGFRGGEWNAVGGYVAVRDDRAHAWAEAFLPDAGWVRVDATPPGPGPARPGRMSELADALEYAWGRWMIGYDLPRQRELAQRAGRHLPPLAFGGGAWRSWAGAALAAVAVAALALSMIRLARRRRAADPDRDRAASVRPRGSSSRPATGPIGRLYARTLTRLRRAGWPRQESETPHEYARRLRAAGLFPGGELEVLTERYAAARFGAQVIEGPVVDELAAKLARAVVNASQPGSPA